MKPTRPSSMASNNSKCVSLARVGWGQPWLGGGGNPVRSNTFARLSRRARCLVPMPLAETTSLDAGLRSAGAHSGATLFVRVPSVAPSREGCRKTETRSACSRPSFRYYRRLILAEITGILRCGCRFHLATWLFRLSELRRESRRSVVTKVRLGRLTASTTVVIGRLAT